MRNLEMIPYMLKTENCRPDKIQFSYIVSNVEGFSFGKSSVVLCDSRD